MSPLGAMPKVLNERIDWLEDEHVIKIAIDLPQADVLVTLSSIEIMKYPGSLVAIAKVLKHAGENWTVSTNGYEATDFGMLSGNRDWQRDMSERVIGAAIARKAKAVVLPECGHAYGALRWEGANVHGAPLPFKVLAALGVELLATSCANCRLTFDDGQQFYKWDKTMRSLLEPVADQLES
jgi:hypothetical protein